MVLKISIDGSQPHHRSSVFIHPQESVEVESGLCVFGGVVADAGVLERLDGFSGLQLAEYSLGLRVFEMAVEQLGLTDFMLDEELRRLSIGGFIPDQRGQKPGMAPGQGVEQCCMREQILAVMEH